MSDVEKRTESAIDNSQLTEMQRTSLGETVDAIAPIAQSWSELKTEELTPDNVRFLLELCLANREFVQASSRGQTEKRPSQENKELANLADMFVVTHKLVRDGYFSKPEQAKNLVECTLDAGYNPLALARTVNNPAKYISKELDHVSPEAMANLVYAWGEINFSWSPGDQGNSPSLAVVYEAMKLSGGNLEYVVSDDDIDAASSIIQTRKIQVTHVMASDPLREMKGRTSRILVPSMDSGELMSFEADSVDQLRFDASQIIGRAFLFRVLTDYEFPDSYDWTEITYDISDAV